MKSELKSLLKTEPAVCREQKKALVGYNNDTNVCFNIKFKSVAKYKALLLVPVFSLKVSHYFCLLSLFKIEIINLFYFVSKCINDKIIFTTTYVIVSVHYKSLASNRLLTFISSQNIRNLKW